MEYHKSRDSGKLATHSDQDIKNIMIKSSIAKRLMTTKHISNVENGRVENLLEFGHLSSMKVLASGARAVEEREEVDVLQLGKLSSLFANPVQYVVNLGKDG